LTFVKGWGCQLLVYSMATTPGNFWHSKNESWKVLDFYFTIYFRNYVENWLDWS